MDKVEIHQIVIKTAICVIYYIVGSLSTTNILRLTKGTTVHIFDPRCYCPKCNRKISLIEQTPIFSYLWNKGQCKFCGNRIPLNTFLLEVFVFLGMSLITILLHFSFFGVLCSFIYYSIVKIVILIKYGRRESSFVSQYLLSVLAMLFIFLLVEFLAALILYV